MVTNGMEPKYVVIVMDRGYYSDINVRHLLKARYKFVCAVDIRHHQFVNECVRFLTVALASRIRERMSQLQNQLI